MDEDGGANRGEPHSKRMKEKFRRYSPWAIPSFRGGRGREEGNDAGMGFISGLPFCVFRRGSS